MYSFDVAQLINFIAASGFLLLAGTAKVQDHNQLPRLPRPLSGASANPTLSATSESFLLVTNAPATVASIQIPHFPVWNSARFSLNPFADEPAGPDSFITST